MISDKKLMRLSLLIALVGILMIFLAGQLAVQSIPISRIKAGDTGKQVLLSGTVSEYRNSNGNIFFELSDGTGSITVVMFERTARNKVLEFQDGQNVTVQGQVNLYKNELEIIANSITKVEI